MATIGQILVAAREEKSVTISQASAATRIKVQLLEAMERNDFGDMAAPAYAKGFVKLYAEYLGIDARPLIREYTALHAPKERPPLLAEPQRGKKRDASKRVLGFVMKLRVIPRARVQQVGLGIVLALLVVVVLYGVSRCSESRPQMFVRPQWRRAALTSRILEPPPSPYLGTSDARVPESK